MTLFLRARIMAVVCLLVSTAAYAEVPQTNQTPQQAIEAFLETVKKIKFPVTEPVKHEELVRKAHAYLDLEKMGSAALADHWDAMTAEDKSTFFDLLWKLVEAVAYPRNQNLIANEKMTYGETVKDGEGYKVPVKLQRSTDAEAPTASLSYHLTQKDGAWKIDDVVLDDVSIIEDLKYQFDKIISKSGVSGLLQKMRERLEKAQEENKSAKP